MKEEEKPTYGITKNLDSWNPIWANMAHYADMLKDMRRIPKMSDKFRYVFQKPGWLPESLGGYRAPYDIDMSTYKKYDIKSMKSVNTYVFIHYIILLIGTAFFLFGMERFDENLVEKSALASLIILSTVSFGALFESRTWAKNLEILRLILIPLSLAYFILDFTLTPLFIIGSFVYIFGSLFWLVKATAVTSPEID